MVVIECPLDDCEYVTPDTSTEIVCSLLNIHRLKHERQPPVPSHHEARVNAPKLNRPFVDMGIVSSAERSRDTDETQLSPSKRQPN